MKQKTAKSPRSRKNKKPVPLTILTTEDTEEILRRATPAQLRRLEDFILAANHEVDAWRECPDCEKDVLH